MAIDDGSGFHEGVANKALEWFKKIRNYELDNNGIIEVLEETKRHIKNGNITPYYYKDISNACVDVVCQNLRQDYQSRKVLALSAKVIETMAKKDKPFTSEATKALEEITEKFAVSLVSIEGMMGFKEVSKSIKAVFNNSAKEFDFNVAANIACIADNLKPSVTIYDDWYLRRSVKRINESAKKTGKKWRKQTFGK